MAISQDWDEVTREQAEGKFLKVLIAVAKPFETSHGLYSDHFSRPRSERTVRSGRW
jgi:hypothetical protein